MVSAVAPNAFENRIRICFPPMETCTICRSVLSVKPGAGGSFLASPSCGEEAHVPTQWSSLSFAPDLLSDGKGFGRPTQIALLQPVNCLHIVLRKVPRVRLVVGIVAKVERHLGHLVPALFEKGIDSVMVFRRVSLAQKWESQPVREP